MHFEARDDAHAVIILLRRPGLARGVARLVAAEPCSRPRRTRLRDDGRPKPKYPVWENGYGYTILDNKTAG